MSTLEQMLQDRLDERSAAGNLRILTTTRQPVDFFSNDYLGLATMGLLNELITTTFTAAGGTGSTGSRLLSGNYTGAGELEVVIAGFHKAEAALLFNSGYDANLGLLSALGQKHTTILYDELCHASIIDGMRLAITPRKYKFFHNDIADLSEKLQRHSSEGPVIVITESVFSMDGDTAHLELIAGLCEAYNAQLIVDEAHATGVFGKQGEGLVCALGLEDKVFARVHTYGKAMGCHGGAVVGSKLLQQYLVNFARPFIYTTALPQHSIRAIHCAYNYLSSLAYDPAQLHDLIAFFRQRAEEKGITGLIDSRSPIQAIVTGSNESAMAMAARAQAAGLQVKAILSPTVPQDKERLRICLHSYNTEEQVERLVGELAISKIS
jgi:8-amino-7-oxononanoate synthase